MRHILPSREDGDDGIAIFASHRWTCRGGSEGGAVVPGRRFLLLMSCRGARGVERAAIAGGGRRQDRSLGGDERPFGSIPVDSRFSEKNSRLSQNKFPVIVAIIFGSLLKYLINRKPIGMKFGVISQFNGNLRAAPRASRCRAPAPRPAARATCTALRPSAPPRPTRPPPAATPPSCRCRTTPDPPPRKGSARGSKMGLALAFGEARIRSKRAFTVERGFSCGPSCPRKMVVSGR